jgi:hypothetical protein
MASQLILQIQQGPTAAGTTPNKTISVALNNDVYSCQIVSSLSTFTAITPLTGATYLIVTPPSGNTQPIAIKGVTGDGNGLTITTVNPIAIPIIPGTTTVGLYASYTVSGNITVEQYG